MILLTGFLGAGKTTLLRAFLATPEGADTAVVVNELGAVGLDQAISVAGEAEVALLGNGCLCCLRRSDLEATFRSLFSERMRGSIPPFRRVVLELSGADDPTPVLQTLLSPRTLGEAYHLQSVVAVVDAATAALALATAPEARRQAALADRLVLSKTDLAAATPALLATLRALNPTAPMAEAVQGCIPADFLLAEGAARSPLLAEAAAPAHLPGLASFTLWRDRPFMWRGLAVALGLLAELRGADLLRVKGLVAVEGCSGPVVIHGVRHILHPPIELAAWPVPGETRSRLGFVTAGGLGEAAVAALIAAVTDLARPSG